MKTIHDVIAWDEEMKKRGEGELAATLREKTLNEFIEALIDSYRIARMFRSQNVEKLKLGAYLACKQKNKTKARKAIDAYRIAATDHLDEVMEEEVKEVIVVKHNDTYIGDKSTENTRQLAETMHNTMILLEWFYNNID